MNVGFPPDTDSITKGVSHPVPHRRPGNDGFDPLRTFAITAKLLPVKPIYWLLIVVAPILVIGGYWLAVDDRSGLLDWIVLAVALVVGLAGIWSAHWRTPAKAALTLAYVPLMGVALAAGLFALECSTGNCL